MKYNQRRNLKKSWVRKEIEKRTLKYMGGCFDKAGLHYHAAAFSIIYLKRAECNCTDSVMAAI